MRSLICLIVVFIPLGSALFFGGGGGDCGCNSCCAPAPAPCAPQPVCAPQPICPPPVQSCGCSSGGGSYAQPQAICPPKYIILQSSGSGGPSPIGGSSSYSSGPSYSAPVAPFYSSGPAPIPDSYSSGQVATASQSYSSGQQIAAPSPPNEAEYNEAAGSASVSTSTAATATSDHPTYNTNAREYAAKTFQNTTRCPNVELLHFIDESIVEEDAAESKRKIYKLLNTVFTSEDGKPIDVICAGSRISYRLTANLSCEHTKGKITCVAYKQA